MDKRVARKGRERTVSKFRSDVIIKIITEDSKRGSMMVNCETLKYLVKGGESVRNTTGGNCTV